MIATSLQSTLKLLTGYDIPAVGYGVYQTPPEITEKVTLQALKVGYRHVDSAKWYENETECGNAIRKSGLDRSQIFFTSKVPPMCMGYTKTKKALEESLAASNVGYIDLMLVHSPYGGKEGRLGTWRAMVEAQQAGKIRSLGVSNYSMAHLEELEAYIQSGGGGQIAVGQYEIHPWCPREDIAEWLRKRNIVIEAYSPLVQATRMEEPALQSLAQKHGKSPAQILLRWSLQKGYLPLPKSVTESRILENSQIFDFDLSEKDMATIQFDEYAPVSWDPVKEVTNQIECDYD